MKATDRECPDDWVVRARRNQLTDLEKHVLAVHLGQCAACRATSDVTTLFEAIPDTQPGDARLIAGVARRACEPSRLRFARSGIRMAVAAGIIAGVAGVAAAATWLVIERRSEQTRRDEVATRGPIAPLDQKESSRPFRPLPAETPPAEAPGKRPHRPLTVTAISRPEPIGTLRPSRSAASISRTSDATSMFTQANATRRSGDLRRAVGLYRALRSRFPESNQALLSALSEGDLLLALSDLDGALLAYDAYLSRQPAGTLTEEALFGRARCLGRLGRTAEEKQTWEELAHRFPRSVYRPAAGRRLEDATR
jgi:TolA-binding protein